MPVALQAEDTSALAMEYSFFYQVIYAAPRLKRGIELDERIGPQNPFVRLSRTYSRNLRSRIRKKLST